MIGDSYRDAFPVELDGGPVVLVRRGSGPPVVLLHGIPLSLLTWRHNVDQLATSFTVHAVDLRGYGRSAKPPTADYSVPTLAKVVERVLDRLGLPAASLVGSSFGCAVAITLAHLSPRRVDKLVLINPVCYPRGRRGLTRLARNGALAALRRSALRASGLGPRVLARPLRRSYANPRLATRELVAAHHSLLVHDSGERTYLATLRALDEAEVARRVPELRQDTLVIWGERDRVLPASHASRMAEELRNARVELVPATGHFPHEESPAVVNQLITAFLAGAGRAEGAG
ncbi:alpha/beta fold hydrolase [Streptoalloteichus hindustanus]|uniref:Pimeloyl-ACP methyl ester carboxylesterase n=1 Tax=Streptoalloteichus hindustanus TaxID=2017 RepID=A0A1M4ZCY2_STRHI|nr:alpha/beta fold hydrolase [Streptoalloteichus hindustanus]SHF15913.1 Pimeloyl-ACP methyl ester carboxylesterase [Streptoalloteichus hindustanus]